jgi:hypothetical protein
MVNLQLKIRNLVWLLENRFQENCFKSQLPPIQLKHQISKISNKFIKKTKKKSP